MPIRFPKGYAVLANRNYRLFWLGQWVSLIGTWMQSATQAWLIVRLGGGPLELGLLGAASSAPMLLLVLFGGVLSDRFNRRHVILATQTLSLLQASTLAILTLADVIRPSGIIALAAVLGAINAFDIPARQAFVIELVGRRDLPNAIALNATGFNVARVAGPALGGFLVAGLGEGVCFAINAVSYLAVLWGLWRIRVPGAAPRVAATPASTPDSLAAGVRYAWAHETLLLLLIVVGIVSAVAVPYRNFLPDVARTVLHVDAWQYGLLMAAAGVGAGMGAVVLAGLRLDVATYHRILPVGLAVFTISLALFAESQSYAWSLALLWAMGAGGIVYFNASHTMVQLLVDDQYRGRVASLYTFMHQGTATFGSLALGICAARMGTPAALLGGAGVCALATVCFVLGRVRRHVRTAVQTA
jgi:MFS family permease